MSIRVKNLSLLSNEKTVFSLEDAKINLDTLKLLSKTISFTELSFSGLYLEADNQITQTSSNLIIAGVNLSEIANNGETESQPEIESGFNKGTQENEIGSGEAETSTPYNLAITLLSFEDIKILYRHNDSAHELNFNDLSLTDIRLNETQSSLDISINASINDAPLNISTKINLDGLIGSENPLFNGALNLDISLEDLDLSRLTSLIPKSPSNPELQNLEGKVSFSTSVSINLGEQGLGHIEADISDANLRLTNASVTFEEYQYQGLSQHIQLNDIQLDLTEIGDIQLNIGAAMLGLESIDLAISDPETGVITQRVNGSTFLTASNISLNAENEQADISLRIMESLIELSDLNTDIETFSYSTNQKSVRFEDIYLTQKPNLEPTLYLGSLLLVSPSEFSISDRSVTPVFQTSLKLSELEAGPFNTETVDEESPFRVIGGDTEYANFNISGWIKPFGETLSMKLDANVEEFPLPQVSPYLASTLGLELKTGQFNTAMNINILDDEIDGLANLDVRGLKLDKASDYNAQNLADGTAISLNAALGVLTDDQGNLELKIPIDGNVNSPGFGVGNLMTILLKKAALSQAKSYVINTFVPYANVVKIATVAGSYALKVRVEPLPFDPMQQTLNESHQAFLMELGALMSASEGKQLKLCPLASILDLTNNKPDSVNDLTPEQVAQLHQLSNTRASLTKAYLIESTKVASSRILLCNPSIQTDVESKPRIEFSLD